MKRLINLFLAMLLAVMAVTPSLALEPLPESVFKSNVRVPQQLIIGGKKLFNSSYLGPNLAFRPSTSTAATLDTILVCTTPSATRTYTIPDAGAAASFLMTAGAQTVTGVKTMSGANVITHAPTGLIIQDSDASHLVTIAPGNESASRTLSIPVLGAADIVMTTGTTQTVGGAKTFTLAPVLTSATLSANADTLTIQDLGNANFVQSEGTQTINGAKTFSTAPTITGGLTAANIQTGSAKRQIECARLSPVAGAAANTTVYRGSIYFGRAGRVQRITYGTGVDPTSGTNVIAIEKGSFTGTTLLSTATVSLNGTTANTAVTATLTATSADLDVTAAQPICCEYNAGTQGAAAEQVIVTVEFEPTDF